jgi:hypothetical protein
MAEITLDELNEKVNEHIGNSGIDAHAIADSATSGFISGLETMTRTDTGTEAKDILSLESGHYFGYGWYNLWDKSTLENPYTSALSVDVYSDTKGNKIIVATENYINKIHIYNDYGSERKSKDVTYWRTLPQKKLIWSGKSHAVGEFLDTGELVDTTTNTWLFDKLELSFSYLGNFGIKVVDLSHSKSVAINTTNLSNPDTALNVGELFMSYDKERKGYVIDRNNAQTIAAEKFNPLTDKQQASFISIDTNLIEILSIYGISD